MSVFLVLLRNLGYQVKTIFKNKQGSSSCKVSRKWLTTLPKKIEKTTGSISLAPTIIATVALDD